MELIVFFVILAGAAYFIVLSLTNFSSSRPSYSRLQGAEAKTMNFVALRRISQKINQPFTSLPYFKDVQGKTQFLRLPMGALEILLIKEILALGLGVLSFLLFTPLHALIAALAGFILPDVIISSKVNNKKNLLLKVFPETVDILDLSIGAGLDFLAALRWVVQKSRPNPFIEQLAIVLSEIQVGKSRSDALRDLASRVKLPDVNSFSRTIIQAERMGISIEEALKNLSEDTRNNRFQKGERQAIKASLKILIPLMFFILPVILIVVAGPVIIQFSQGDLIPGGGLIQ